MRLLGILSVLSALVVGCRPDEQIETYKVPVLEQTVSAPVAAPAAGAATDRMLAAIVPHGDRAWFFKVVGPTAAVDQQAQAILDFFATIRVADDRPQPAWQLPAGWTEQAGSGMRAATIAIPAESIALELSVIALPWTGGPTEVLGNVNRWRGQLQLPEIESPGLADCTREVTNDGTRLTIVDLAGRMQDTGMTAPFAGGPFSGGPAASGSPAAPPAATPPAVSSAPAPSPVAALEMPQIKVPEDWQSQPATPPRKAAFSVADGGQQAVVTVIDFPAAAGPMIADPLQNLNRWRREVGLPEISAAQLPEKMESIEIAGLPAKFFAVLPDEADSTESQVPRATLAAMVAHGDHIWFFKITGDRKLVAAQREQFRAFVDSVRFSSDEGANDGDG